MDRVLVDTSALIAMSRIGELDLLADLLDRFHVTPAVFSEATEPDEPGASSITALEAEGSLVLLESQEVPEKLLELGLGPGEASLIAACRPEDRLVLDDANARRVAQARELRFTGLLGLMVTAVETGNLSTKRGLGVLKALARSDFRMTVEMYDWARERMKGSPPE